MWLIELEEVRSRAVKDLASRSPWSFSAFYSKPVARFPTKPHFASYNGTAPIEASSGDVVRYQLSCAGNRAAQLSRPLSSVVTLRWTPTGGTA
ncbi:MAG: transposase [Actinomycetota bacterium]